MAKIGREMRFSLFCLSLSLSRVYNLFSVSFFFFNSFILHRAAAVFALDNHDAAVPLAPPRKHKRLPDLEDVGLAQRGPPGAEPRVPLAGRAQGLVRDQPLAVPLVEHAYLPAEDDGVGLAARGRARRGSPRIFVVPRRRLAAGVVSVVREQVGGHGRVDVHAVEVRGA